jgi:hypothetical protein
MDLKRGKGDFYRKRPVVIEALQIPTKAEEFTDAYFVKWGRLMAFLHDDDWEITEDKGVLIRTLEGKMKADPGDWIIRGVKGEPYPCKPEIFKETYEPAQ